MESLLPCQKLLGFVNGQILAPPSTIFTEEGEEVENPILEAWICTDELVKSWIFGTLTEETLGYVHNLATSREVWISLADNFNKSSIAREFELKRWLQLLSIRGKDFLVYCREFRSICDQLSSIGRHVDESMKIFTFMNGLGREYDPITTVLQSSISRLQSPSFNDVVSEISGFDSKLKTYEPTADISPHMAFQTQRGGFFQRGRGSYSRFGSTRGRGNFSTRGRGFSQQVNTTGWNQPLPMGSRLICQICGKTGYTALKCWSRFDNAYQSEDVPQALSALQVVDTTGKEWYPDSGATACHQWYLPHHFRLLHPTMVQKR